MGTQQSISNYINFYTVYISEQFAPLLYKPTKLEIFDNLPLAFITTFKDVTAIIDCFEIEIAKPSQSSLQALTFSNYKYM